MKNKAPKRPKSGMLSCYPNTGLIEATLGGVREETTVTDQRYREFQCEGNEKLLSIAIMQDATEFAKSKGYRIAGKWDGDENLWSVPVAAGPTPTRTVRIEDSLWEKAKKRAAERGTNVSAVVVEAIQKFVADEVPPMDANLVTGVYEMPKN